MKIIVMLDVTKQEVLIGNDEIGWVALRETFADGVRWTERLDAQLREVGATGVEVTKAEAVGEMLVEIER